MLVWLAASNLSSVAILALEVLYGKPVFKTQREIERRDRYIKERQRDRKEREKERNRERETEKQKQRK